MSTPSAARPTRDPVEARILEVAEAAMLKRGAPDLRVSDVVAETGTSVGTVYTVFGSKAGLIAAVIEDIQDEVVEFAAGPLETNEEATWEQLIDLCVRFERVVRNDFRRLTLVGQFLTDDGETDEHAAEVRQRLLQRLGTVYLATGRLIERLGELGLARPNDPYNTAGWIYSTFSGATLTVSHMPPWIPDAAAAQTAIFRTQRQMLAQALLPVELLDDQGMPPRQYWMGPRAPRPS